MNWADARANCLSVGGELASIHSAEQNAEAYALASSLDASSNYYAWIGFNDLTAEGTWAWSDGSTVDYTNWNDGEPNNSANGNEDCAHIFGSALWNDATCSSTMASICNVGLSPPAPPS